ncbi:hypothetical protein OG884_00615 [Streptosporangium sp. NBC_01755]|nr:MULTISPECIES: hypothetical protein [unclassified Streptosporangium]WSA28047.1 hypothetical protein OIE13_09350 [Streptosporangium sp. NBC_01810]WSD00480.1 hypothetical protein OG884_00615 [Streptosporangium sp. NBC_01755]
MTRRCWTASVAARNLRIESSLTSAVGAGRSRLSSSAIVLTREA